MFGSFDRLPVEMGTVLITTNVSRVWFGGSRVWNVLLARVPANVPTCRIIASLCTTNAACLVILRRFFSRE